MMSWPNNVEKYLKDGRNIIPIRNSDAKCLIENWVEERFVKEIDPQVQIKGDITSRLQLLRHGHKALFTNDYDVKMSAETTYSTMFTLPKLDTTRKIGARKEQMQRMYYNKISKEKGMTANLEAPPTDFRSVKMVDYDFDYTPVRFPAIKDHNYRYEQPVTFWTEHRDRIHGRTASKTRDTGFRRNDAFTKPIWEYCNETKPYEQEDYPKM